MQEEKIVSNKKGRERDGVCKVYKKSVGDKKERRQKDE
jgi:hypothetical protein